MVVEEVRIVAGDGVQLAATLFLPGNDGPFPALLEALPYRKDDVTASYRSTYERYAAAGFATLRLDLRGTGSSGGAMLDEYTDTERADLRTVIEWLASQRWSSGRVGMFGTSYSGFNGLHMACEGIEELGAVVATYATDDRYTDDVHYAGGILRALDLIDYPLYMVAMNALPPVPALWNTGDPASADPWQGDWRSEWLTRLDQRPWLLDWITDRHPAPVWRRGSLRLGPDGAGYERMSCPTMLIAGWADGYRNNTFRTVEQFVRNGLDWRLLAGPWVHSSPERARPGPNVDDDVEILAFFDEHLRDGPPRPAAPGQVYVREPTPPQPDLRHQPGSWCDLTTWPPDGLTWPVWRPTRDGVDSLAAPADVGIAAWNSCGGGLPWGQPLDQRTDNARSIVYDWPVTECAHVVGNPTIELRVRTDQAFGQLSVKLCDVAADGTSTLVSRTWIDLAHVGCWPSDPHGAPDGVPRAPTPGDWIALRLDLEATTWTLRPGHVLRVAVAGSDWPNCWPAAGEFVLDVDAASLALRLPVVDLPASEHPFVAAPGLTDTDAADEAATVTWRTGHDVLARTTTVTTRYGGTYEGSHGAVVTDDYRGEIGVSTADRSEAWARGRSSFTLQWPEVTVGAEVTLEVRSDRRQFVVDIELVVHEDGTELARRSWQEVVAR
jgi:predicted acyl esterase